MLVFILSGKLKFQTIKKKNLPTYSSKHSPFEIEPIFRKKHEFTLLD